MTIRTGTIADADDIVRMVGEFIGSTAYRLLFAFNPGLVRGLVDQVLEHGIVLLAEVEGETVGLLVALAWTHPLEGLPMCDEMIWWVNPAHRSGLVGPKMLRCLEDWARQKGLQLCKMVAPAHSTVGEFYLRHGYVEVETSYVKRF